MDAKWRKFVVGIIRVFVFAFLGVFIPGVTGIASAPDWEAGKAAAVALVSAAIAAGCKAVLDTFTKEQAPAIGTGVFSKDIAP